MPGPLSFRRTALAVIAYGIAMAYVEAAVVVYLQRALGSEVGVVFPLRPASEAGDLVAIEAGREVATLAMIAAVGLLAGRTWSERLAWAAVAFGTWDIGYYAWLRVLSDWPPALGTLDVLFLLPVLWVGPVWSPMTVSAALIAVGLASAWRSRAGLRPAIAGWHLVAGLGGGFLVILSYTLDAPRLMDGGLPGPYPWPVFAVGLAVALAAAIDALRSHVRANPGSTG